MVYNICGFENIHYDEMYFVMRKMMREKPWLNESPDGGRPNSSGDHKNNDHLNSQSTDIQNPSHTLLPYDNLQGAQIPTLKSDVEIFKSEDSTLKNSKKLKQVQCSANLNGDTKKRKPMGLTDANKSKLKRSTNYKTAPNLPNNKIKGLAINNKPVSTENSPTNKKKQITDDYKTCKVTTKPALHERLSLLSINRQMKQKEIKRENCLMVKRLKNVKASVSSFR